MLVAATPLLAHAQASSGAGQGGAAVEEVVVTARRVEENLQEVPLAVTAMSSAALERRTVREIRDIIAVVPNLNVQNMNGATHGVQLGLRGQSTAAVLLSVDSPVGVYIDGVNVPHAYGVATALVDLDRVEVLRGPQGTLYGRNTTGGAISFITKDPGPAFGGRLQLTAGNYGLKSALGVLNVPLAEGLSARFVAYNKHLDGYGRDIDGRRLLGEDDTLFRGKVKASLGDVTLNLSADYIDYSNTGAVWHIIGLVPGVGGAVTGGLLTSEYTRARGLPLTPENLASTLQIIQPLVGGPPRFYDSFTQRPEYSDFKGINTVLQVEWAVSDSLTVRSISGYRELKNRTDYDLDGTPVTIQESPLHTDSKFMSEEFQFLGDFDRVKWVAGFYYSHEKGTEWNLNIAIPLTSAGNVGINDGDLSSKSYAAFGQLDWSFADQWTLTLGGRWTKEDKGLVTRNRRSTGACIVPVEFRERADLCSGRINVDFKKPSWLASIRYQPTDAINLYAKVATGFRGGGHNMRGTTVASYAPFEPETVTEYEVGLKSELFDRRLRLNLAAFYDDYKNAQRNVLILVGTTTVTRITNAAAAELKGFEAEATWRPLDGLMLEGSLGYTDAKYKRFVDFTGDRSNEPWQTPDFTGSLSARFEHSVGIGEMSYQLNYVYRSSQNFAPAVRLRDQVTQKGFGLLDGRVALALSDGQTEVAVFGRNLAQKHYYSGAVPLEPLGFNTMATGEPRTVGVQLTHRLGGE
jgi:iron complex outermembrane receptor protein